MVSKPPSAIECARLYLSPPANAFWRWSKDHSAIEFCEGGATIMLREELAMLFQHRSDGGVGMPPLQAIVILSALLRPDHADHEHVLRNAGDKPDTQPLPDLTDLRERIRNHPPARAVLYDWLLHSSQINSASFSERAASAMAAGLPDDLLGETQRAGVSSSQVMQWIRFGMKGLTPERLELLARTGVDSLSDPAATDAALQDTAKSLLQTLSDDERFTGFAQVVMQAMAALRVPRLTRAPEDQAQGGVAGLSNRGSLDRLAISELAHDDHVLAVRIATNEALYVEREVPETAPDCHRRLLLDCGVRMWGSPRVLSVAVALALCANSESAISLSVATVVGGNLEPVDLGSHLGLIAQLERIDWDLDLRSYLPDFLAGLEAGDEPVVIVNRETADDPTFRSRLAGHTGRMFVVDITEVGEVRMWEVQSRGWRQLSEVTLSTDGLLRRSIADGPNYYRIKPEPLAESGANSPDVVAVTWSHTLGIRIRRGRVFTVELTKKGHATWRQSKAAYSEAPFLPHPEKHEPPLTSAQLGAAYTAFWDGRLLHLVPRHQGERELTLGVSMQDIVVGYCSEQGVLLGEDLVARLKDITVHSRAEGDA